ncbi:diguanylate cyclase [Oceanithermus sp.]
MTTLVTVLIGVGVGILAYRAWLNAWMGRLAAVGLVAWGLGWLIYALGSSGFIAQTPSVNNLVWGLLYLGYVPFLRILVGLSRKVRMPPWLYLTGLLPLAFVLVAERYSAYSWHLYGLMAWQVLLLLFGLPAWYAVTQGKAPEGRALWIPTLIFIQIGITSWAAFHPALRTETDFLGLVIWLAGLWLIVEGLRLEQQGRPLRPLHLTVMVAAFLGMWAMIILRWYDAHLPDSAILYAVGLAGLSTGAGILSVVLPLHMFKSRSEAKLVRWASILSDLALFPIGPNPPTPESITQEIYDLLRRVCDNVVGLRLSVFDNLLVGERTRYGLTLRDGEIDLGRLYLGGERRCDPFLKLLVSLITQRLTELIRTLDWQVQAHTDPLTGLFNRRGFEVRLPLTLERAIHRKRPLTLAMLDLDRFKQINDRYGHAAGDVLLQAVAEVLERNLREGDLAVRWGGEEFLIVLSDSDLKQAIQVFERVRARVADLRLTDVPDLITVSIGLAGGRVPRDAEEVRRWILEADEALIRAKDAGRNRVVTYE